MEKAIFIMPVGINRKSRKQSARHRTGSSGCTTEGSGYRNESSGYKSRE